MGKKRKRKTKEKKQKKCMMRTIKYRRGGKVRLRIKKRRKVKWGKKSCLQLPPYFKLILGPAHLHYYNKSLKTVSLVLSFDICSLSFIVAEVI